ncbi:MAG: hypothetical protein K6D96_05815 [Acetatifactor sp.]|nr:hypothetical protein [Acetatifactor sp.]
MRFEVKEVRRLCSKAVARVNPDEFDQIVSDAAKSFEDKDLCFQKIEEGLGQIEIRRFLVQIVLALVICFDIFLWIFGWDSQLYAIKFLQIALGTCVIPFACFKLIGKDYHEVVNGIFQIRADGGNIRNKLLFNAISFLVYEILMFIVFPEVNSGPVEEIVYNITQIYIMIIGCIQLIYGSLRFPGSRHMIWLGSGMIHSFFLIWYWGSIADGLSETAFLLGFVIVPIPLIVSVILMMFGEKNGLPIEKHRNK